MMRPLGRARPVAAALIVAGCTLPMLDGEEDAPPRVVSGALQTVEPTRLPAESDLVVSFRGLDGEMLAEERSRIGRRTPPYDFDLLVPADRMGTVAGSAEVESATLWRSVSVLVEPGPEPVDLGRLFLSPVEAGFEPAGGGAVAPQSAPGGTVTAAMPQATAPPDTPPAAGGQSAEQRATLATASAVAAEGPAATGPIRLDCGESEITVNAADGGADVVVGETVVEMQAVEAGGGGRRYAVPDDPATYLALDGEAVEVSFAGVVLPDCAVEGE